VNALPAPGRSGQPAADARPHRNLFDRTLRSVLTGLLLTEPPPAP